MLPHGAYVSRYFLLCSSIGEQEDYWVSNAPSSPPLSQSQIITQEYAIETRNRLEFFLPCPLYFIYIEALPGTVESNLLIWCHISHPKAVAREGTNSSTLSGSGFVWVPQSLFFLLLCLSQYGVGLTFCMCRLLFALVLFWISLLCEARSAVLGGFAYLFPREVHTNLHLYCSHGERKWDVLSYLWPWLWGLPDVVGNIVKYVEHGYISNRSTK